MATRQDSPEKPQRHSRVLIILIVIGLLLSACGPRYLSSTNQPPAAASATHTPVPEPSATATSLPPTVTPSTVPTATPTASPTAAPPAEAIELAIVHSNDTWGYVLPCG